MTPPTKTRRAFHSKLDKLRLLVAAEIIRNSLNTDVGRFNIRAEAASTELCEQYCLKLFLHWLATKYGSSVCAIAIQRTSQADDQSQGGCKTFKDQFPFYSYFSATFEDRLRTMVFEYLDANLQPRLEDAGSLYMQMMVSPIALDADGKPYLEPAGKRRRGGEFYTPPEVVDYCLEESGFASRCSTSSPWLVDPACGTGNFLLGALRALGRSSRQAISQLHGYDIDGRAVAIARALLLIGCSKDISDAQQLECVWQEICRNVRVLDATAVPHPDKLFDVVITNPPYLSFGSRNQPPMARSHDRYLRGTFPSSAEYKLRLHSIFQEIAINWCAPGGSAVLLVPDAYLTGSYYGRLRSFLIEHAEIVSLTELPESTFDDAVAGRWCVAHYRVVGDMSGTRDARSGHALTLRRESVQRPNPGGDVVLRRYNDDGTRAEFILRQSELISRDAKLRFQLVFNRSDLDISLKLSRLPAVSTQFRGHTGIRAKNGQASIIAEHKQGDEWKAGIVSGAEVQPYRTRWSGNWLRIEPKLLFGGGFNPAVVEAPKVVVRQTADRLIGALDIDGLYHLNNVHSFSPLGDKTAESAAFLCALMNSRLWLYLYQLKSREQKRALAQIDIEMVESLPLPPPDSDMQRLIATAGSLIASPLHNAPAAGDDALRVPIERAIYDMYQLTEQEIEHIEATIALFYAFPALCASEQARDLLESLSKATI